MSALELSRSPISPLIDVVGLPLNPPEEVVLCMDEKTAGRRWIRECFACRLADGPIVGNSGLSRTGMGLLPSAFR